MIDAYFAIEFGKLNLSTKGKNFYQNTDRHQYEIKSKQTKRYIKFKGFQKINLIEQNFEILPDNFAKLCLGRKWEL